MSPLGDTQQADQQVQFAGGNKGRAGRQQVDRGGRRCQQWQQGHECIAALPVQAEAAQAGKPFDLKFWVAQLPYRSQQRLFTAAELAAKGTVADPGGKQGGAGGHGS